METLARIFVDSKVMSLDREFYYKIPESISGKVQTGQTVLVPFGHGRKTGIVVGFTNDETDYELKEIIKIKSEEPIVGEKEIELAFYMQKMYIAPFFDCLKLLCSPGTFGTADKKIRLLKTPEEIKKLFPDGGILKDISDYLESEGKESTLSTLKAEFGPSALDNLKTLREKKIIFSERMYFKSSGALKRKYITLNPDAQDIIRLKPPKGKMQIKALEALEKNDIALSECEKLGFSASVAKALVKKGIAKIYEEEKRRNPFSGKNVKKTENMLPTKEQETALNEIFSMLDEDKSSCALLHGVTGSGKTEVFMQAIERVLKKGRGAIVLVPEISLTPQMTDRFLGRFGDNIAILHSVLSKGERIDEWMRIKRGEAKVVIGARSAVFAPLDDIGIIIVDEEHENTYKSEQTPKYDAVDIAKKRCEQNGALLLLASATPAVTNYYKAQNGEYRLIKLKKRYNEVELPKVTVADMRLELKNGNRSMLSKVLQREIQRNLDRKEQTVLFLNRRGFSTFVSCRDCGYVAVCPECAVALTYHKSTQSLNCHYCGYKTDVIKTCPSCKGHHVKYFGSGTQKLENEINKIFPGCSVIRMDVDTASGKNAHEKILKKFSDEKIDILLGTQMVSKGLDFPGISLVGVVAADMSLNIDDYRASERTFDLITQVCGRAGRGEIRGRAVIQTYSPDNAVIQMAKNQDYEAFYQSEIAFRNMFGYPPYNDIILVGFSSEDENEVKNACVQTEKRFREALADFEITLYKSSPAPVNKIKGRYRWRFWFKAKADPDLRDKLRLLYAEFNSKKVKMSVTVDPLSMF